MMVASTRTLLLCCCFFLGSRVSAVSTGRAVAHRVLLKCFTKNAFAERALHAEFTKADAALSTADQAFATELVYGVMRTMHEIDYCLTQLTSPSFAKKTQDKTLCALRIGAYEVLHMSTPDFAAVSEAVSLVGKQKSQRSFANGVLRNLVRQHEELRSPCDDAALSPLEALAIETSTPQWLLRELAGDGSAERALLSDFEDLAAWARASQQRPGLALRVNRRRATRSQVLDQLRAEAPGGAARPAAEAVQGLEDAILLDAGGGRVSALPGFAEGHWTVQDVGAQCVGLLAAPSTDGARCVDLCAAPGGKATHAAERLVGDDGHVLAVEVHARKAKLIQQACERLGLDGSVSVRVADATQEGALRELLAERGWESGADAVVLDAPCSGVGTLRRNPEHRHRPPSTLAQVAALGELQARLLDTAAGCVRVGGTLTYSVCSPLLAETDERVAAFLQRTPGFELVRAAEQHEALEPYVAESALLGEGTCVRTWTHMHPADSHFAVALRRCA